jgi:hypothetical protein
MQFGNDHKGEHGYFLPALRGISGQVRENHSRTGFVVDAGNDFLGSGRVVLRTVFVDFFKQLFGFV